MKFAAISGALKRSSPRMNAGAPTKEKKPNTKEKRRQRKDAGRMPAVRKAKNKRPGKIARPYFSI
jgi:hypothetical protein